MSVRVSEFAFLAVIFAVLVFIACCGIVMILWNWLLPPLFGFKTITFWQALGLSVLCNLLFNNTSRVKSE